MNLKLQSFALLLLSLYTTHTDAQQNSGSVCAGQKYQAQQSDNENKREYQKMLIGQFTTNGNQTGNKATSTTTSERLIAESTYKWALNTSTSTSYSWQITDSSAHGYSGQRGSYFNLDAMNFDRYYLPVIYTFLGDRFGHGFSISANDNIILSDSTRDYSRIASTYPTYVFAPVATAYSLYDASNNTYDYSWYSRTDGSKNRHINTFTPANQVSSMLYLESMTSIWDTTVFRNFGYASDQLIYDSINMYNAGVLGVPVYKYEYYYTGLGSISSIYRYIYNTTSAGWSQDGQWNAEYYPTHQLKKLTNYSFVSGSPEIHYIDTFGWTAGINYYTYREGVSYLGGLATARTVTNKHVSATTNFPDNIFTQTYFPTNPIPFDDIMTVYTYDSYQQPVLAERYQYRNVTSAYDSLVSVTHYYYETYTRDNTGVGVVTDNDNIQLYPNPTNGFATLQLPQSGNNWNISVMDIAGRLVQKLNCLDNVVSLDFSRNANGLYLVRITNTTTNETVTKKIVLNK